MSIYAIGDIQGCQPSLLKLLDKIRFDPQQDQLWFAGDLVNRGPGSLDTLRFVKDLGEQAVTVLGNHDLHLLAVAHGYATEHSEDTLTEILNAPDRDELLDWLRMQPLIHHDPAIGYTMIHAGLPPQWDHDQAISLCGEVESILRSTHYTEFLNNMYGNYPDQWQESLEGWDRLRYITNCLTRLRYCNKDGLLCLSAKGSPGSQPSGFKPWFEIKKRASRQHRIIFGHWSTLGFHDNQNIHSLDGGCLWGGSLGAIRLDKKKTKRVSIDCPEWRKAR